MPKFQVDITRTITDRYIVTAEDWEEAEDLAAQGDIPSHQTKFSEESFDTEEI